MIFSGLPSKNLLADGRRKESYEEGIMQPIENDFVQNPQLRPNSFDGTSETPRAPNQDFVPLDAVHYNLSDPYHPLRLNPTRILGTTKTTCEAATDQEPGKNTGAQVKSSKSKVPTQGLPVVRESGILRWVSWSREEETIQVNAAPL